MSDWLTNPIRLKMHDLLHRVTAKIAADIGCGQACAAVKPADCECARMAAREIARQEQNGIKWWQQ